MTAAALALSPPEPSVHGVAPSVDDALACYRAVGEEFLARAIGNAWCQRVPGLHDAIAQTPIDEAWLRQRHTDLEPMSEGPARLVPRHIWNLARALMQPGDAWFDLWRECALRTPREWLVLFCGVAMCRADGSVRGLNHRAKSMLVAGVLAWQLAEYDPEGDPAFPYVIRGLPYGTWECLLSYWEHRADGYTLRRAKRSTVHGTHRTGGDGRRGQVGYIATWKRVGIAYSRQPPYWAVEPGLRGKGRVIVVGGEEVWRCWAFHELRLRIPAGSVTAFGPPHQPWWTTRPRKPPSERDDMPDVDLVAAIEAAERTWLGAEAPVDEVPVSIVSAAAGVISQVDGDHHDPEVIDAVHAEESTELAEELVLACLVPVDAGVTSRPEASVGGTDAEPLPVWLVSPAAAPITAALPEEADSAIGTQALALGATGAELELQRQPDAPPTCYGAGKLIVMRADESSPVSPRLRARLERFERAARWRERGPPRPPD